MQGIRPQNLTDEELVKYAALMDVSSIPEWMHAWFEELRKRLEYFIDAK